MRKTGAKRMVLVAAVVLVLVAAAVAFFTLDRFVIVEGHLYARNESALDLREREVTCTAYDKLKQKLPGCTILWNVPFQGEKYPSFASELTVDTLSWEDVDLLDYFPQLETLQAQDCQDYEQLMEVARRKPNCQVNYHVQIDGRVYDQSASTVKVTELTQEDARKLTYLPKLRTVNAQKCMAYQLLGQLQQEHPDWNVIFDITVGGEVYETSATSITASNVGYEELSSAMSVMKNLQTVTLTNPTATGEELLLLRKDYPNVDIHWTLQVQGRDMPDDTEEVDISGQKLESLEEAKAYAAYFPSITKLIMTDCGFDNETMAAFREEMRSQYKVVWTVYLGSIAKCRTDATKFMPLTQGDGYFQDWNAVDLKYCEDLIAIDIGHSRVKHIEFVAYMPHLKYLILADTDVRDITPISNCKELVWLELSWCAIESYEPLLGCTALEDLNLSRTFADPEPVKQMTWLKNLWCMERGSGVIYEWTQALPNTHVVGVGTDAIGYGWRKLPNYYKMRDALDMYYMR